MMNDSVKDSGSAVEVKPDTHSYQNRLIHESSPYLLQHAHNPVDWHPWGTEAFEKAKKESKPVLVSIGYAACHWCHVMERESFEDPEVAELMNQHFVNIKVDREERPDVDHIYMDAVQAISGSGGWPLNVFITPEGKPFYGGTYFPPRRAFNRSSWTEVLLAISNAYQENKNEIEQQADTLTEHLKASNALGTTGNAPDLFDPEKMETACTNILHSADEAWGGFGKAPKFPQTFTINFLFRYGFLRREPEQGIELPQKGFAQALLSLDKMMQGGIYDHVGGGFSRYSTDTEWLAPHFEKMLYDNALLVSTLCEASQITRDEKYLQVIDETLEFIKREMMDETGGFYSALDADSEGVEGKFYVWDHAEVTDILGPDAEIFCSFFDITEKGNWEEKNILRTLMPLKEFAAAHNIGEERLKEIVANGKQKLLQKRGGRIRPQLDDKVLLGWNALMNTAFSKAYAVTGNEQYRAIAIKNMNFLLSSFPALNGTFYHTWKNDHAKFPAFLDDYSYLISALTDLSEITADVSFLTRAREITDTVLEYFSDPATNLFFYTASFQSDILLRKKEIYDGAIPSGNAVMAQNLYRLSIIFDKPGWKDKAVKMVFSLGEVIIKYPTSFGVWLSVLLELIYSTSEIAIVGKDHKALLKEVLSAYIPHRVVMGSLGPIAEFPMLRDKLPGDETLIFLCRDYACQKPVVTMQELEGLLKAK